MALYRMASDLPKKTADAQGLSTFDLVTAQLLSNSDKQLLKNKAASFDDIVANTVALWMRANNHEQC